MAEESAYALEPLREATDFILYRGRERGNPTPILALATAAEHPSPQNLRRLTHEYSLATELDAAWAAQPLALTRHQGRAVLILKDPGGQPLDRVIEKHGQSLDLNRFLRIAIGLAGALSQAHRQRLIHKDVKPANVLVDEPGRVWLTGFGVASRLVRERLAPAPPEIIAGTLPYMSPEQTGRMNRSVDSRSDLYSLGVTLYEMLTGALPFTAADPLEWVHCHIARRPVAPAERREVPELLSAIIMRLLAKNAEERYQTAAGLQADLRRCLSQWQSHGQIEPFALGADDISDQLLIAENLYGREREVAALLAAFDRVVSQGTAQLVLVSGYSGVGKSSVVNELHKALVPPHGHFAAGKFDQYRRDVPYATLVQAFQMLVRQILVKSEAEVAGWRRILQEALGPNGQLIVNLIPEVEFVIGKQPPVADLPPQEARGRFQLVFRRFLGAFARPEHPLALFLDDLQWVDTASLELLGRLTTDPDVRHVLLIGAYRDNEVGSSHPLTQALATIRTGDVNVHEIVLAPLGVEAFREFVSDSLRARQQAVDLLAQLIHEKTGGNPFSAIQFLTSLADEGLLQFDREAPGWTWDLDRIRAKGYSDNVVDLMVAKLRRLSASTLAALQQLACIGNAAENATLSVTFGQSEQQLHAALLEAVRTGLILRLENSYCFSHDRVQETAYASLPEAARVEAHLRIGRALLSRWKSDGSAGLLFDVASQFNRSTNLLTDRNERLQVAAINLGAARKAKASAAYASARAYCSDGMSLLDESDWSVEYELMLGLRLERAECELLAGDLDAASQLIEQVLPRAASKADQAAVCSLKVQLQVMRSEIQQAVATALSCLNGFGICFPEHPTLEQVRAEYEAVQQALNGRPIESLIDLPLMTDPDQLAAASVLSVLFVPAYLSDFNLVCLQTCRLVKLSLQHGPSGASTYAYASWMVGPGWAFRRYDEAYRFARLACELVERHGFIASQARVYASTAAAAPWTQPVTTAIELNQKSIRAATAMGDFAFACFAKSMSVPNLLLRTDPLDELWRTAAMELEFVRKVQFSDLADTILSQQRFIAMLQGRTASLSTFGGADFDESEFEKRLAGPRMPMLVCSHWLLKLQACFLSGDLTGALAAGGKAKPVLDALAGTIRLLDYYYYMALTVAALYEGAPIEQQRAWWDLLAAHREQLREWAECNPATFADKHMLVLAEVARLEKRDADALQLYERAIQLAREQGFVKDEALANELAAKFYLARGIETAGYAYVRNARNYYERWGAGGKVKQLEEHYPRVRPEQSAASSAAVCPLGGQWDIDTVVKASQALSSEIILPSLIEKLVKIALESAGAERGVLILLRGAEPRIEAEVTTGRGGVEVIVQQSAIDPCRLSVLALNYVVRTQEAVLLEDACADKLYSMDEYVRQNRSRSVLCLPIVKQARLVGALYLENNLTPGAFTPDRIDVLRLLASQAAISLENAHLLADLRLQAGLLQRLPVSAWTLEPDGTPDFVNQVWLEYSGQTLDFIRSNPVAWMAAVHPEDREAVAAAFWDAVSSGRGFAIETRSRRAQDGSYRRHLQQAVVLRDAEGRVQKFIGTTTDIDDQKRVEEALRQAQGDLARINRVTTMGELAASLAHELGQPISGAMTSADTGLLKLGRETPDLDGARMALNRIVRDTRRAAAILGRIRSLFVRGDLKREVVDVNEIIREMIALLRGEAIRYNISVRTELTADLLRIVGDRVQLQQVAMNLFVNSIEAMKDVDGLRELVIRSQRAEDGQALVSVSDTGVGFPPHLAEQIFDPFFTTKPQGTGMRLRISRSIVESHGGRLWAVAAPGGGATFHLSLPAAQEVRT
jgi:PAS domain S-box-containing protein